MQREIVYDHLDHFIAELNRLEIGKVAFTSINEKRAIEVEPGVLQVVDLVLLEVLAYRESTIYKCRIENADLDQTHDFLLDMGFEVTRRSRNIT